MFDSMVTNEQVLQRIKELIQQAPPDWVDTVAAKMNKSISSVYSYATGRRGIRKGLHKDVLKHLKKIVEEDQAETKKLISGEN